MLVNICGFGWSGSGAYLDLLREYDDVTFPTNQDWEFTFLWAPDGLYDLEQKICVKHCRVFDSDLAIRRFLSVAKIYGDKRGYFKYDNVFNSSFYDLCKHYVEKLVQFRVKGYTFAHRLHPTIMDNVVNQYNLLLKKLFLNRLSLRCYGNKLYNIFYSNNYKDMYVSYMPDDFSEVTQDFVSSLLQQVRTETTKTLVLNQTLPPDVPHLFDHYFREEHKTIIIRRDPRDNFILINELKRNPRPVPHKVEDFIVFYKKTIADTILPNTEMMLSLNYEDLIYNYDETVIRVEEFLGLKKHTRPFESFSPKISINNTQLFKLYPEYESAIKKIENSLKEYLYPFEKYKFERTSNKVF